MSTATRRHYHLLCLASVREICSTGFQTCFQKCPQASSHSSFANLPRPSNTQRAAGQVTPSLVLAAPEGAWTQPVITMYMHICWGHSAMIASCANEATQSWWMDVLTNTSVPACCQNPGPDGPSLAGWPRWAFLEGLAQMGLP